jgi:hypothetical protein
LLTVDELWERLARAFALDDADVVLDLSGVQFLRAATIDVIVRAKDALDLRSPVLTLRSPSESAQRAWSISVVWPTWSKALLSMCSLWRERTWDGDLWPVSGGCGSCRCSPPRVPI